MPDKNNLEDKFKNVGKNFKNLSGKLGNLDNSKPQDGTAEDQNPDQTQKQAQNTDGSKPETPVNQVPEKSDWDFRRKAKKQDQEPKQDQAGNTEKTQKNGSANNAIKKSDLMDKMDNWSKKHLDSKQYGPYNEGVVARGQKNTGKQKSSVQQIKEQFEEKMLKFKESARVEPIKPRPGDSNLAFRRRQQREDDENPDNLKDRSIGNAAKNHATKYARMEKAQILAKNPRLAAIDKTAREKTDEIRKRSEAIKRQIEIKAQKLNNRVKELKRKANLAKMAKQKLEDEAKKLALKIAQAAARFAIQILIAIAGTFGEAILIMLGIAIAISIIYAVIHYACNTNILMEGFCSLFNGGNAI